jgi:hypothetical protein
MTKTAWTEHVKACKGMGLTREEIRQWYWAEKEAKEAELEAANESDDEEEESDEEETQLQLAIGLSLISASKDRARKASKTLAELLEKMKSIPPPKDCHERARRELVEDLLTRRQAQALLEKSAKDFIQNRNVSVPFSKIRRPAFHRP